jgi:hypothetical protein
MNCRGYHEDSRGFWVNKTDTGRAGKWLSAYDLGPAMEAEPPYEIGIRQASYPFVLGYAHQGIMLNFKPIETEFLAIANLSLICLDIE